MIDKEIILKAHDDLETFLDIEDMTLTTRVREYSIELQVVEDSHGIAVPKGAAFKDIYVLGHYDDDNEAVTFSGWEWGRRISQQSIRMVRGAPQHSLSQRDLHPMKRLLAVGGRIG